MKRLFATLISTAGLTLGLSGCAAQADGLYAGIEVQDKITMADTGLPAYPGARPEREDREDKSNFGMSLWGGSFGLKLQILKFRSDDSIDQVSSFYHEAMGRYGKVLDCSVSVHDDDKTDEKKEEGKKISLRCDRSDRKEGKLVYKVGTDSKHFRLVSMQREGKGVSFQVVNLAVNGD